MHADQAPFDVWLKRDLASRFSATLKEPLPAEFLQLLPVSSQVPMPAAPDR